MASAFELGGRISHVAGRALGPEGDFELGIDGELARASLRPIDAGAGRFVLEFAGHSEPVRIATDGDRVFVHLRGETHEVRALDAVDVARREARAARGDAVALAPMPGAVVERRVDVGDSVEIGTALLVIESMKLQTTIEAELAGTVAELPFAVGDSFEQGAVLARVEAAAQETSE